MAVEFGAARSATFTVVSPSEVTATAPAGTGTVAVRAVSAGGASKIVPAASYTYVPPPTVSAVSPRKGTSRGGTELTISGSEFTGATAVHLGATAATGLHVVSSTELTATTPPGSGTVDVTVTTPGGTSATGTSDGFRYVPAPVVTSVRPSAGPLAGGESVTVRGSGLTGADRVEFGTVPGTGVHVVSSVKLVVVAPAHPAGVVQITVTTPEGTSRRTPADRLTYEPAPRVTSVTPSSGPAAGGTVVTLHGEELAGVTTVQFGERRASHVVSGSPDELTATAPPGTGTVTVTATSAGGTSTGLAADKFAYEPSG